MLSVFTPRQRACEGVPGRGECTWQRVCNAQQGVEMSTGASVAAGIWRERQGSEERKAPGQGRAKGMCVQRPSCKATHQKPAEFRQQAAWAGGNTGGSSSVGGEGERQGAEPGLGGRGGERSTVFPLLCCT